MNEQGATIHVTDAQAALLARILRDWLDDGFSSDESELRDARKWLLVFGSDSAAMTLILCARVSWPVPAIRYGGLWRCSWCGARVKVVA